MSKNKEVTNKIKDIKKKKKSLTVNITENKEENMKKNESIKIDNKEINKEEKKIKNNKKDSKKIVNNEDKEEKNNKKYSKKIVNNGEKDEDKDEDKESLILNYSVGNAFDILEKDTKTYKCIYLDPPYASGRDYKFAEKDETAVFTDKFTPEKYKEWLTKLLSLCKKRLAKDGTLWFHIAAEYSFIPEQVLQSEFKEVEKNFWKKSHGKNTVKNKMGAVIDIIFRCYNSTPIFNLQYVPLDAYYFKNSYRNKDEKGLYALGSLRFDKTRSGNNYEITNDKITYKAPYGWKIRKEEMERLISEKRIHFVPPNEKREGNLYKKLYKSECKGKPLSNLWDDISYITRTQQDPRTYPTQKPLKLLQRIISISTNKGDLVLDPTAGSGTTGVACKTLGRNCYLIDINTDAKKIFEKRLTDVKAEEQEESTLIEDGSNLSNDSV